VPSGDPDRGSNVGSARREGHGGGGTPIDTGVALVERELEGLLSPALRARLERGDIVLVPLGGP